jgi:hypothetical protein
LVARQLHLRLFDQHQALGIVDPRLAGRKTAYLVESPEGLLNASGSDDEAGVKDLFQLIGDRQILCGFPRSADGFSMIGAGQSRRQDETTRQDPPVWKSREHVGERSRLTKRK